MKKKLILVMMMTGVMLTFAACGNKDTETSEETATEATEATDAAAESTEEVVYTSKLVKLGEYKGVAAANVAVAEVTDEEVQAQIDALLTQYTEQVAVEGKTVVEDGDIVNIDYKGLLDGVAFDGGTAEGFNLTIGSDSFIDGFEDQLVGKEVGGSYELNLTFPEDYSSTDLAGQDVVFEVIVNNIMETVVPEYTDEFVTTNFEGYTTAADYTEYLRSTIEADNQETADTEIQYNVLEAVINGSEFECDENEIADLVAEMTSTYESYASAYGMDYETFLASYMGTTKEDFELQCEDSAIFRIESSLAIDAIAEAEGLTVSDEEYTEGAEALVAQYGYESVEAFEEAYTKEAIMENLVFTKVVGFLVENAVLS